MPAATHNHHGEAWDPRSEMIKMVDESNPECRMLRNGRSEISAAYCLRNSDKAAEPMDMHGLQGPDGATLRAFEKMSSAHVHSRFHFGGKDRTLKPNFQIRRLPCLFRSDAIIRK